MTQSKIDVLSDLRARIAAVEKTASGVAKAAAVSLGPALDAGLPGGGLVRNGLHLIGSETYRDRPASLGFTAGLAACLAQAHRGPLVWCRPRSVVRDWGALYGPGLAAFGLDPARLILADAAQPKDVLWVAEESVRIAALAGVVAEVDDDRSLDLTASRRLQLAAEACGTPVLLLAGSHALPAVAASTHWRIGFAASGPHPLTGGLGLPCWQVQLAKCRGGSPQSWLLEWDAAACRFELVQRDRLVGVSPPLSSTEPALPRVADPVLRTG